MTFIHTSRPHNNASNSRGRFGSRRGQSLVEFSFIAPLMLLTATGMVSFGLAIFNYIVLTQGVNSATNTLSMSRGQSTDPCATAWNALHAAAPSLGTSNLTVSYNVNGYTSSSNTCTPGATYMVQGQTVTITASYPCALHVYGLSGACGLKAQTAETIQ